MNEIWEDIEDFHTTATRCGYWNAVATCTGDELEVAKNDDDLSKYKTIQAKRLHAHDRFDVYKRLLHDKYKFNNLNKIDEFVDAKNKEIRRFRKAWRNLNNER